MRREVHPALIHHALGEVSGIGRIVGGENAEELIPAGEEVVVVADVGEELEGRRRGGGRGGGGGPGGRGGGPGVLQAGGASAGGPPHRYPAVRPASPARRWGSSRCREGVAPVAPLSSRTTTTSLVTSDPVFERQPKYATYTV